MVKLKVNKEELKNIIHILQLEREDVKEIVYRLIKDKKDDKLIKQAKERVLELERLIERLMGYFRLYLVDRRKYIISNNNLFYTLF